MPLSSEQLRAARAMARMDQADLASRAGVSLETIKRLEKLEGNLNAQESTLESIRSAFRAVGITFIEEGESSIGGGGGIRMIAHPEDDKVKSALEMMAKTIEAAAEKLGLRKNEVSKIVGEAKAETYLKISRETMRKALGPNSLPSDSKSVQLLRKYITGELKPSDDDESE